MTEAFMAKIASFKGDQEAIDSFIWSRHQEFMLKNYNVKVPDRQPKKIDIGELKTKISALDQKLQEIVNERARLIKLFESQNNNM